MATALQWSIAAMLVSVAALFGSTTLAATAGSSPASSLLTVKWTPCGFSIPSKSDNKTMFECTSIPVPLCHPGVCKSNQTISIFVKRIPAKLTPDFSQTSQTKPRRKQAYWMINGGPGPSSAYLEQSMARMYQMLNGSISFYTSDHRGTGRSGFLHCGNSSFVGFQQLPGCFDEALAKIEGHVNAFSTSSAAMDHKLVIRQVVPHDSELLIHGFSYGSNVLQRIVQIAPLLATRFIFDGVDVATTKGDPFQSDYAHYNQYILAPSRLLLETCFDDSDCPFKFHTRESTVEEVLKLYKKLDDEVETNACSKLLMEDTLFASPSVTLQALLSSITMDLRQRKNLPLVLAKLQTCTEEDRKQLRKLLSLASAVSTSVRRLQRAERIDPVEDTSQLLAGAIVHSDSWAKPLPSVANMMEWQRNGPFSMLDAAINQVPMLFDFSTLAEHCIFIGQEDDVCVQLFNQTLPKATPFVYPREKLLDQPITFPRDANVLIFNGGLDFQTPKEFGELLVKKIKGITSKNVISVTFPHGYHCGGDALELNGPTPCKDSLIQQFAKHSGDVAKIDQSCLATVPKLRFATSFNATRPW